MDMKASRFTSIREAHVDARAAPAEVVSALPGMDQGKVASLIAARIGSEPTYGPAPLVGRAFSIRIELQSPNGPSFRDVAIRLTARPDKPYWVLSWKSL